MPKGTTLTSYNPSLRDKIAWALSDAFGGGDRTKTNWINDKVRGAVDLAPVIGDVVGFDDAKRNFDEGNYGAAALDAGTSAVGSVPGVGDALAAALKGGGSMLGMVGAPGHDYGWLSKELMDSFTPPDGVNLKLQPVNENSATFDIEVDPALRGAGLGSSAMEDLIMMADELGVELKIRAEPDPEQMSQSDLMRWYQRFGFERHGYHGLMNRTVDKPGT